MTDVMGVLLTQEMSSSVYQWHMNTFPASLSGSDLCPSPAQTHQQLPELRGTRKCTDSALTGMDELLQVKHTPRLFRESNLEENLSPGFTS